MGEDASEGLETWCVTLESCTGSVDVSVVLCCWLALA